MQIRPYRQSDETAVVALWKECGLTRPWNDPHRDIARKLHLQADWFLVGTLEEKLVATVMTGYDGHRGWVNYLAVANACRGRGYGRLLMARAEQLLHDAGCPKINLQVRAANTDVLEFYRRIGYREDDVVSLGKRLIADGPPGDR